MNSILRLEPEVLYPENYCNTSDNSNHLLDSNMDCNSNNNHN